MTRPVGRPPGGIDGEPRTKKIEVMVSPAELETLKLAGLANDPPESAGVWMRRVALALAMKLTHRKESRDGKQKK